MTLAVPQPFHFTNIQIFHYKGSYVEFFLGEYGIKTCLNMLKTCLNTFKHNLHRFSFDKYALISLNIHHFIYILFVFINKKYK